LIPIPRTTLLICINLCNANLTAKIDFLFFTPRPPRLSLSDSMK
jgi:hypothetical protein